MEHQPSVPPEREAATEREPQPHDVTAAMRELIAELAPDADPEDAAIVLDEISAATDLEEALGIAAGAFAILDVDYELGMAKLGDILQFEDIRPNGDQE